MRPFAERKATVREGTCVSNILDQIVADKRQEIAAAKARVPLEKLRAAAAAAPPPRDFFSNALRRRAMSSIRS